MGRNLRGGVMTVLQEFGSWWFHTIFQPYGRFVYVENLGWATIVVAIVTTILLGLFYKPNKHSRHSRFMEHYGFPLILLSIATVLLPTMSVVLVFIMPGIIVIGGGIGILFGLFIWLQNIKERRSLGKETVHREGD